MTLVDFLRARLDERAAAARNVLVAAQRSSLMLADPKRLGTEQIGWDSWPDVEALACAALSDVEAQRGVVTVHVGLERAEAQMLAAGDVLGEAITRTGLVVSEGALRILAAPYERHPDYDPAWKVDDLAATV